MKYQKHLWLFLIFAVAAVVGWMMSRPSKEGFMSDDEYLTELNHRIRSIQTLKKTMNDSVDLFDKGIKDTCDITVKYRDEYQRGRARIEKYNSLSTSERNTNVAEDYKDERNKFMVQNRQPLLECFANPGDIRDAQATLRSEMKDLRAILDQRKLRTLNDKGALAGGLYELNASFFGQSNRGPLYETFADPGASEDREGLLDGADTLIKEARTVQDTARTTAKNVTKLNDNIGKVAEYIEKRGKVSLQGMQRVTDISSYFYGAFTVGSIGYTDTTFNTVKDSLKDFTSITITNLNRDYSKIKYPDQRVLVYGNDGGGRNIESINTFLRDGGNMVLGAFTWAGWGKINTLDYDRYSPLKYTNSDSTSSYSSTNIKVVRNHPILEGLEDKTIRTSDSVYTCTVVSAYNENDVIANNSNNNTPLVAVKTIGSQRIVALNMYIDRNFNEIGKKLIANCILWAAGRI